MRGRDAASRPSLLVLLAEAEGIRRVVDEEAVAGAATEGDGLASPVSVILSVSVIGCDAVGEAVGSGGRQSTWMSIEWSQLWSFIGLKTH